MAEKAGTDRDIRAHAAAGDTGRGERILWLDGLKGLAAILIFTHHFLLGMYPATYFGEDAPSRSSLGWDRFLSVSPLGVFTNGNFLLCLFFVISAFFMALGVMRLKEENYREKLGRLLLKRYPRLLLPVLVTGILNYLLIHLLTFTGLNYIHKTTELSPLGLLLHSLILQWITTDSLVLGPFWMLHLLLFGSFLAMLIAIPDRREYRFYPFVILLLSYAMGCIDRYYAGFCFGVFLADLYWFRTKKTGEDGHFVRSPEDNTEQGNESHNIRLQKIFSDRRISALAGVLFILLGLFLGGYPSYVESPENIYRIFGFYVRNVPNAYEILHCLGAAFFLAGLFLLPNKRLLESRPVLFLGKLTFPIYLVHIMWIEYLGYFLVDLLIPALGRGIASAVTYLILLAGILFSSLIYQRLRLI